MGQERLVLQEEVGSEGECDTGLSECGQAGLFVVSVTLTLPGSCPKSRALLFSPVVELWGPNCQSVSKEEPSVKFTWRERMPWQCGTGSKSDGNGPCLSLSITGQLSSFLSSHSMWNRM